MSETYTLWWEATKETIFNVQEYAKNVEYFDIQNVEDLYKFFFMCHIFSWVVLLWKLR